MFLQKRDRTLPVLFGIRLFTDDFRNPCHCPQVVCRFHFLVGRTHGQPLHFLLHTSVSFTEIKVGNSFPVSVQQENYGMFRTYCRGRLESGGPVFLSRCIQMNQEVAISRIFAGSVSTNKGNLVRKVSHNDQLL